MGFRIRELRTSQDMTQAQLAEACGLHRTYIGSVERGERNVAILNLQLITQMVRVPLAELFGNKRKEE